MMRLALGDELLVELIERLAKQRLRHQMPVGPSDESEACGVKTPPYSN